ncbi:hypothetical protein CHH83_01830 [Bacillus sp. 7586-K]|nr:hypothetical protein CHH83_01830 [Bacillus sp. 7586-K]
MDVKMCNHCGEDKSLDEFYSQEKVSSKGEKYIYYRPDCKECCVDKAMKWRGENREAYLESCKRRNSKPAARERIRKANKRRRDNGDYYKWLKQNPENREKYNYDRMNKKHEITDGEWENCKLYFDESCAYCGLTIEEHKEDFNQDFHKEHVDHEGSNKLDNCVPACKMCNSSKWAHPFESWYTNGNPVFNKSRLNRILNWLNEDYKKYIKVN